MRKNKIKTKIFYCFLLICLIFGNSAGIAEALFGSGPDVPSVEEALNDVEKHYGFDQNILRRSKRKANYPQVEVFFDNNTPTKGEKVTATALPKYFRNTNEKLYYTWFLFRDGDSLDSSDAVEEAKVRAMGMVARGDFDPFLFNTDYSNPPNEDKDGYDASYGGDDGMGGKEVASNSSFLDDYESAHYIDPTSKQTVDGSEITRCYRHNFGESSNNYSVSNPGEDLIVECEHKFPEAPKGDNFTDPLDSSKTINCDKDDELGDASFDVEEEACWRLDPENSDTDGDGVIDEADLVGLGQEQFTWTFQPGDRVGIVIEGTSTIAINEDTGNSLVYLTEVITYDCSNYPDNTYCVDSSYDIGGCFDGSCHNYNCASVSENGYPCETAAGATGTCQSVGNCQAVPSCSSSSSSNGDLCETGGIQGTCQNSSCIISRCGSSGDSCQTSTGTMGVCSDFGICEEDYSSGLGSSVGPYYKITWAGMDICDKEEVEGEDKEDLIEDDECENSDDYGFTYLATKTVAEQPTKLLESNLNFSPTQPQFYVDSGKSDYITVSASLNNSGIDDAFVYYDWDIYSCDAGSLDSCTQNGTLLTDPTAGYCSDGDSLGECSSKIDSNSFIQGMGLNQINFRLNEALSDDNFYLKVFLRTKESENDSKVGVSSVEIPVTVNDNKIKIYQVSQQSSGDYGFDINNDEICSSSATNSSYAKICPVFPGQVIALKADVDIDSTGSSVASSFSWKVNNKALSVPGSASSTSGCDFVSGGCSLGDTAYIAISGSNKELQKISLKAKKSEGEEITSERLISVAKPMARIESNDTAKAWRQEIQNSNNQVKKSEKVFVGKIGETVSFKAGLVPSYLDAQTVNLVWYLNNQKVDTDFINNNSANQVAVNGQDIEFKLTGQEGESINLAVEVEKSFSSDEEALLEDNWQIKNLQTLVDQQSINIKKTQNSSSGGAVTQENSMKMFMASTFSNAPDYFIFIIKSAIVFVLFWSLTYGFDYWFAQDVRKKSFLR